MIGDILAQSSMQKSISYTMWALAKNPYSGKQIALSGLKIWSNLRDDCTMNEEIQLFWSLLMLCRKWVESALEINVTAMSMKEEPNHCSFCVWSKHDKTFSDLLNAHKKQLDTSLATASVITWAFAEFAGLESQSLDGVYIESFVHASTAIWLELLKRLLLESQMTDAGEIMQEHLKRCSLAQAITTYSHDQKVPGWNHSGSAYSR